MSDNVSISALADVLEEGLAQEQRGKFCDAKKNYDYLVETIEGIVGQTQHEVNFWGAIVGAGLGALIPTRARWLTALLGGIAGHHLVKGRVSYALSDSPYSRLYSGALEGQQRCKEALGA